MLLTIKTSEESWKSPDGQRTIWGVTDETGNKWQTMSRQIAQAIGQTMELTTRVSAAGKTYLVKPPVDGVGGPQASSGGQAVSVSVDASKHFLEAVEKFARAVDKFSGETPANDDLPPIESYQPPLDVVDDL